jgi:hypothetical protein
MTGCCRRRRCRRCLPSSISSRAPTVRPVHPSIAPDRRCLGSARQGDEIYAATLQDTTAGGAAPETWLRNGGLCRLPRRQGRRDQALSVLDQAEPCAGQAGNRGTSRQDRKGEKIEPFVAGPSEGASEILLDSPPRLTRRRRAVRSSLSAIRSGAEAQQRRCLVQLAAVSEQLKDGEGYRPLSPDHGQLAVEGAFGPATRPQPRRSRPA